MNKYSPVTRKYARFFEQPCLGRKFASFERVAYGIDSQPLAFYCNPTVFLSLCEMAHFGL